MTELEIEEIKEIDEIKHSKPCLDFLETIPCIEFEFNGKITFIQY